MMRTRCSTKTTTPRVIVWIATRIAERHGHTLKVI